jgi:hypothetical protein
MNGVSEDWLEMTDEEVNVEDLMRMIRQRIDQRRSAPGPGKADDPKAIAGALRREMIGDASGESGSAGSVAIRQRDCDIVPRYYAIEWRIPILGPIHALVRRIINDEIRRYLMPSLRKQSTLNRQMLRAVRDLNQENARLRQEVFDLRGTGE